MINFHKYILESFEIKHLVNWLKLVIQLAKFNQNALLSEA